MRHRNTPRCRFFFPCAFHCFPVHWKGGRYFTKEESSHDFDWNTHLDISHDAPTPIGMKVWAEAEITAVSENGKMVDFAVKAWDESGPIGSGTHTRAIVKNEKFLAKCNAKLEKK